MFATYKGVFTTECKFGSCARYSQICWRCGCALWRRYRRPRAACRRRPEQAPRPPPPRRRPRPRRPPPRRTASTHALPPSCRRRSLLQAECASTTAVSRSPRPRRYTQLTCDHYTLALVPVAHPPVRSSRYGVPEITITSARHTTRRSGELSASRLTYRCGGSW